MCYIGPMIHAAELNLSEFLSRWYGQPDEPTRKISEEFSWLPEPLKDWYSLSYRWGKIRSANHQIYKPQQIRMKRGKLEFAADYTGDWFWAFDPEDSNAVYEAELHGDWRHVPESLSKFLNHVTVREVAISARFIRTCSQVPDDALCGILADVEQVDFGEWGWLGPGRRSFMNQNLIIDIGPARDFRPPGRNREGFSSVRVSGISLDDLGYLDEIPMVNWLAYAAADDCDS